MASAILLISRGQLWGAPLNLLVSFGFFMLGLGTLRNRWGAPDLRPRRAMERVRRALASS